MSWSYGMMIQFRFFVGGMEDFFVTVGEGDLLCFLLCFFSISCCISVLGSSLAFFFLIFSHVTVLDSFLVILFLVIFLCSCSWCLSCILVLVSFSYSCWCFLHLLAWSCSYFSVSFSLGSFVLGSCWCSWFLFTVRILVLVSWYFSFVLVSWFLLLCFLCFYFWSCVCVTVGEGDGTHALLLVDLVFLLLLEKSTEVILLVFLFLVGVPALVGIPVIVRVTSLVSTSDIVGVHVLSFLVFFVSCCCVSCW